LARHGIRGNDRKQGAARIAMGGQKIAFVLRQLSVWISQDIDNPLPAGAHFMQVKVRQGSCVRFAIEVQARKMATKSHRRTGV
jgi:hypothetical protein